MRSSQTNRYCFSGFRNGGCPRRLRRVGTQTRRKAAQTAHANNRPNPTVGLQRRADPHRFSTALELLRLCVAATCTRTTGTSPPRLSKRTPSSPDQPRPAAHLARGCHDPCRERHSSRPRLWSPLGPLSTGDGLQRNRSALCGQRTRIHPLVRCQRGQQEHVTGHNEAPMKIASHRGFSSG